MSLDPRRKRDGPMGNLGGRPHSVGNRYPCWSPGCDQTFMSDEALQLHMLYHMGYALINKLTELQQEGIPVWVREIPNIRTVAEK